MFFRNTASRGASVTAVTRPARRACYVRTTEKNITNRTKMTFKSVSMRLTVAATSLLGAAPVGAALLYSNHFSAGDTAGWSWSEASPVPLSSVPQQDSGYGRFLGEFGGDDLLQFEFKDAALDKQKVTVGFDFFAIRSWDGGSAAWGADSFRFSVNGDVVLEKSFSNGDGRQTFTTDARAPDGTNDGPQAGSLERQVLGYRFWDGINGEYYAQDAVYRMVFSFDSPADVLSLSFAGLGLQDAWVDNDPEGGKPYRDESWGIDNVWIALGDRFDDGFAAAFAVPEPSTALIGALGLGLLAGQRRRSGRSGAA